MKREFEVPRLVRIAFVQVILAGALISNSFAGFFGGFDPFAPKSPLTETQKCNVEFNKRYLAIGNIPDVEAEFDTRIVYSNASDALSRASRAVNFPVYRKKTSAERDVELVYQASLKIELEALNGAPAAVKIFISLQAELAKRKNASKIDFPDTDFKMADDIVDTNLDTMFGGNNFK